MRGVLWIGAWCVLVACGSGNSDDAHSAKDAGDHGGDHTRDSGSDSTDAGSGGKQDAGPQFDAGSDPNRNHVKAGQVCARLAAIQCAGEAACCDDPGRDVATCRDAQQQRCMIDLLLDDVSAADDVGFDPEIASMAFAELEQRASVCDPSVPAWAASPDGFLGSLTGTLVKGESCEPEGGLTASPALLTSALLSCQLASGVACLPSKDAWTCEERVGPSGRCFIDLNCADGLFCDNPMSSFDGMCKERKAKGEGCRGATECISFVCADQKCAAENDVQAAYCL
jgi:hypothetical protein